MKVNIVMLPGLATTPLLYEYVLELMPKEFLCKIVPLKSCNDMGELAHSVANSSPAKFILVGTSMGGGVALEVYSRFPRRILGLCLAVTTFEPDSKEMACRRQYLVDMVLAGKKEELWTKHIRRFLSPKSANDPNIYRRALREVMTSNDIDFLLHNEALSARRNFSPVLPKIRVPVLLLCGKYDSIMPMEYYEEKCSKINKCRLVALDTGHMPTIEDPVGTSSAITLWVRDVVRSLQTAL